MNIEQLLRFALQDMTAAKYARITSPEKQAIDFRWLRNTVENTCGIEGLTLHLHYEVTKKPNPFRPYYVAELRHISVPGFIEMPESFGVEYNPQKLEDVIPGIDVNYTKSKSVRLAPFIPE